MACALRLHFLGCGAAAVLLLAACKPGASPDDRRAQQHGGPATASVAASSDVFATTCVACHGPHGQGNEQLKAPSIAGRPAWYVLQQLKNFRMGRRGFDPADTPGALMAPIAKALTDEQIHSVAKQVEHLAPLMPVPTAALHSPDVEEGKLLFAERCMECHRYNASGELTFGSPPLTGLQDWYLLAQIDKFKTGRRGVDTTDPYGTKMKQSSQFIESEQAKHDVVAFILSLNMPATAMAEHNNGPQAAAR